MSCFVCKVVSSGTLRDRVSIDWTLPCVAGDVEIIIIIRYPPINDDNDNDDNNDTNTIIMIRMNLIISIIIQRTNNMTISFSPGTFD